MKKIIQLTELTVVNDAMNGNQIPKTVLGHCGAKIVEVNGQGWPTYGTSTERGRMKSRRINERCIKEKCQGLKL